MTIQRIGRGGFLLLLALAMTSHHAANAADAGNSPGPERPVPGMVCTSYVGGFATRGATTSFTTKKACGTEAPVLANFQIGPAVVQLAQTTVVDRTAGTIRKCQGYVSSALRVGDDLVVDTAEMCSVQSIDFGGLLSERNS